MTAAPPPTPPTVVPLAAPEGHRDAIEVSRHFGKRHDPEPVQPLIRLTFVQGEDAIRTDYWLSRGEAQALIDALTVACIPPSKETKA